MTMTSHVRRPSCVRFAFVTPARAFCVLVVSFVGGCGSTPVVEHGENLENGAKTGAPSARDAGRA